MKTTARPRRALYRYVIAGNESLALQCTNVLAQREVWIERERPRPRQINIRPYIETLLLSAEGITAHIWLTQEGSARAEEISRVLQLPPETTIERTHLEILDEVDASEAARTPRIELQTRPWTTPLTPTPNTETPNEVWGATSNGPVVE